MLSWVWAIPYMNCRVFLSCKSRLFFISLICLNKSPRVGEKTKETTTKKLATNTITGPVERLSWLALIAVPKTPENAPIKAARKTITAKLLVHCLAAAAGASNIALIKTTPTVCSPITIAKTIKKVIKISINFVLNPRVLA